MPVIPSFSAFAATPNLGAAYTGGAELGLQQQRIVQSAAQANAEIQMQGQKLDQARVQNEMELAARDKALQAQTLHQQQAMEIEKAYKEQVIGLKQSQVQQAAQKLALATDVAARKFQAQQKAQAMIAGGMDPIEAWATVGPEAGTPSGAYTAYEHSKQTPEDFGALKPVLDEAGNPTGFSQVATGRGSRRILKTPNAGDAEATPIAGAPGYMNYNGRVLAARIPPEIKEAKADLKAFDKAHAQTLQYITGGIEPPARYASQIANLKSNRADLVRATLPAGLTGGKAGARKVGRFQIISED